MSFSEASQLLSSDVDYLEIYDEAHSITEDRFIAIGPIASGIVLVVCTERSEDVVRIISVRWATPGERATYYSYAGAAE